MTIRRSLCAPLIAIALAGCGHAERDYSHSRGVGIAGPITEDNILKNELHITTKSPNGKVLRITHAGLTNGPWDFPAGYVRFSVTHEGFETTVRQTEPSKNFLAVYTTDVSGLVLTNDIESGPEGFTYRIDIAGNTADKVVPILQISLEYP